MKKRIFASLLAICMLATSVFAATGDVIFTESFELEPVDNFYVSIPEIRAYSENLITNGNGTFDDANTFSPYNITGAIDTTVGYDDTNSLKITKKSSNTSGRLTMNVTAGELNAGDIIELEAYIKSAQPYDVMLNLLANNANLIRFGASENGARVEKLEAKNDWQRISAIYTFAKDATDVWVGNHSAYSIDDQGNYTFYKNATDKTNNKPLDPQPVKWTADGIVPFNVTVDIPAKVTDTTAPLYVDGVKIRKITNAVQATGAQVGMPTYPVSALAGKTNAQVGMYVKNESGAAKDLTLITAYYNADGSLNEVLNVYNTSVASKDAIQYIRTNEFSVPAGATSGEIKTFAWDDAGNIFPYTNVTDSTFATNHARTLNTTAEARKLWGTPLPGTNNVYSRDQYPNNTGTTTATFTNAVLGGNARTGARALNIAAVRVKNDVKITVSGVQFQVEPGRKYQLDFYANQGVPYAFCPVVTGASRVGDIRSDVKRPVQVWTSAEIQKFQNSGAVAAASNNGVAKYEIKSGEHGIGTFGRPYGNTSGNRWQKFTCTFETPAADALAADYAISTTGLEEGANYWETFGTLYNVSFLMENYVSTDQADGGKGAWIDDITVTDLGPAE